MTARAKCLAALVFLAVLGIGPIPTTTLLGFYVVLRRPAWFRELIQDLYAEAEGPSKRPE
ncbi:MAG: hypothetical protein FJ189_07680 [Gammaproteobacteria bacterium]|nr:hypothetical protein [Gammaproteobacteria bacterium]